MAKVNPPSYLKTPSQFKDDITLGGYFEQLEFIVYQLWTRTGGQEDFIFDGGEAIEDILLAIIEIELRLDIAEIRLDLLEARVTYLEGSTVVTAIDVTAEGNQLIICTDALTVTMNAEPLDKDVVEVKATNGKVIINGNGNTIDGESTITIRRNNTGLSMEFSTTADAWFII